MDDELKELLASLDARLASIEMILKVIANNSQGAAVNGGKTYYFPITPASPTQTPGA